MKFIGRNKDRKSLIENFISLSSLRIIGILIPLINLPYVIRTVGLSHYGVIVIAASLINYFTSVTDYSFTITATRDVALFKASKKKLDFIYSQVMTVKAILFLASSSIILIVSMYEPFIEEKKVFLLTIPMLLGYALFPEWFFQGIEKMKYITFLNLGFKLLFTLSIFIFITKSEDYWKYPLLQSAGFICSGIIAQVILLRKYRLRLKIPNIRLVSNTLRANFPIFVNQFMPTLYNNTSTFLLGLMTTPFLVGIYDAIKKIIDLCVTFISITSRVFFPFLNRKKAAFLKYEKLMLLVSLVLMLIPIISYKIVLWYLNIDYEFAFELIILLSLGIVGYGLYDIYGINYFIVHRQDRLVMKNTIFASIVGFILSYPLIHFFGILGAAVNLSFTRLLMGGSLFLKYKSGK